VIGIPEDTTYAIRKEDGSDISSEDWTNLKSGLLGLPRNPTLSIARSSKDDKTVLIDIGYSSLFYIGLFEGKMKKLGYKII